MNEALWKAVVLGTLSFLLLNHVLSIFEKNSYHASVNSVKVAEVRVAYRIVESATSSALAKPPVVFLPGFNSSYGIFEPVVDGLRGERRCILIDLPPFGASDRSEHVSFDVKHLAEYVIALLDRLGIAKFSLVSHSMGAHVALFIASQRPESVEKLVLISPAYPFPEIVRKNLPNNADFMTGYLQGLAATFEITQKLYPLRAISYVACDTPALWGTARDYLKSTFEKVFIANNDLGGRTMMKFIFDNLSLQSAGVDFSMITAQTLVVHGDQDETVPLEVGQFVSSQIKNAQLLRVPAAGHYPFFHELGRSGILSFLLKDQPNSQ